MFFPPFSHHRQTRNAQVDIVRIRARSQVKNGGCWCWQSGRARMPVQPWPSKTLAAMHRTSSHPAHVASLLHGWFVRVPQPYQGAYIIHANHMGTCHSGRSKQRVLLRSLHRVATTCAKYCALLCGQCNGDVCFQRSLQQDARGAGRFVVLAGTALVTQPTWQNVRDQRNKVGTERSNTFALEALAVALQQPVRFMLPAAAVLLSIREMGRMLLTFNPNTRTQWGECLRVSTCPNTFLHNTIRPSDCVHLGTHQRGGDSDAAILRDLAHHCRVCRVIHRYL